MISGGESQMTTSVWTRHALYGAVLCRTDGLSKLLAYLSCSFCGTSTVSCLPTSGGLANFAAVAYLLFVPTV